MKKMKRRKGKRKGKEKGEEEMGGEREREKAKRVKLVQRVTTNIQLISLLKSGEQIR